MSNLENHFAYEAAKNAAAIGTIIGAKWIEVCDASVRGDGFVGIWIHATKAGLTFRQVEKEMGASHPVHYHWIEAIDQYGQRITERLLDCEPMNLEEMRETALKCIRKTAY